MSEHITTKPLAEQLAELRERATPGEWWRTESPWGCGETVHCGPSDDPHAAKCFVADGGFPPDDARADEVCENMAFIAFAANHAAAIAREAEDLATLVLRLSRRLESVSPGDTIAAQAKDFLERKGYKGSILRETQ